MASDVMSLFGMDPAILQQQQNNKAVSQASSMNPYFAAGAAGGQLVGSGINSAFGLQTPEMARAQGIQDSLQGADLESAAGLRQAASQLMMAGNYAEAMALHAKAAEMESATTEELRAQQQHELGSSVQVIVGQTAGDPAIGLAAADIKHSVTYLPDGRVEDATLGKTFATRAEWMNALGTKEVKVVGEGGGPNNASVLKSALDGQTVSAESILETTAPEAIAIQQEMDVIQQGEMDLSAALDAYEAMMPQEQQSPQGVAFAAQIAQMQADVQKSTTAQTALEERQIKLDQKNVRLQQAKAIERLDNRMNALMESYKIMPKIMQESRRGKELKEQALVLRSERAALIESQQTK